MFWNSQSPFFTGKFIWIVSVFLGLLGSLLVLFITSRYGAGVSGDSIDYLSTANNLTFGKGFVDYSGNPYLAWPPLYPLILAGIGRLSGGDTFQIGKFLNVVLFGILISLTGFLFINTFPNKVSLPIWGMLAVVLSPTLLRLAAIISTDILFIVLVILYAIMGAQYITNRKNLVLLGLSLIAGFAAILRWHGVLLIASVVLLVFITHYRNLKTGIFRAVWAGALSSFLFCLWVIGRNFREFGTLIGFRETSRINILFNLTDSGSKISRWFFPVQLTEKIPLFVLFSVIFILLIFLNRRANWSGFFLRLTSSQFVPLLIFIPIYYFFVLGTSVTYEHVFLFDDRYYAPLFVFFFLFIALIVEELILHPIQKSSLFVRFNNLPNYIFGVILFVWCLYPAFGVYKYAMVSRQQGEPTYNIYNTKLYHESQLIKHIKGFVFDPEIPVYSNFPAAVYFFTGITTLRSPNNWITNLKDLEYIKSQYQNWPPSNEAYFLWFPYDADFYYSPEVVSYVADLTAIYTSSDGNMYYVRRK